jgi:DnaJ-class molecular chaperone
MFFGGDPFEGMGGMGGMGGRSRKAADSTGLYKTLGVAKSAQPDEIKKAYRKLAREAHPDKGGDVASFRKIQEAFDVLGNEEKRTIYDDYGMEGLRPTDLFDTFVGMMAASSGRRGFKNLGGGCLEEALYRQEVEERMKAAPEEVAHDSHPHALKRTRTAELAAQDYEDGFSCDVCDGDGSGWVYHCDQCGYDAHPWCVGAMEKPVL